ncbi:MAG: S41 family peptidase [Rikenellaceae bacterium]
MKRVFYIVLAVAFAATSLSAQKSDHSLTRNAEILINVMRELDQNYVDQVDPDEMMEHISESLTKWLDPYTQYMDEEEARQFEVMTTGEYGGIGSVIRKTDDGVVIAQPYKGSPADMAGFKIGDLIYSVNNIEVGDQSTEWVSTRLKGVPNTDVYVTIKSTLDGSLKEHVIKRKRISIPAIPYYGFVGDEADSVGYIRHDDFTSGSAKELRAAAKELIEKGAKSLILDYRANGGGVMQEAVDIVSIFAPRSTEVVTTKSRRDSVVYRTSQRPLSLDIPLAVLISQGSASAAEIVAGAIQDLDRGVLLGERSFGKGLVQMPRPVGYNSYLKLTTSKYFIPSGRCIQAIDYSDHSTSSQSKERLADSLKRRFTTVGGREVFDGGGVTPDIEVKSDETSGFVMALLYTDAVSDYADDYFRRNYAEGLDLDNFRLSDEEFSLFKSSLEGRDVPYSSATRAALKKLKSAAQKDNFDNLTPLIESLEEQVKDDVESNVEYNRDRLTEVIESEIVLRFAYNDGVIRHSIKSDEQVLRAIELLTSDGEYSKILGVK